MSREETAQPKKYYTIVQGTFRTQVPQDHPEAVRRDWTSADGKTSGTKYERIIRALYGYITDVSFADSEFGKQIYIKLDKNMSGEEPTIALNVASREAEDFMKKLPNIDLTQEVQLKPYSFTGDESDEVRGMSVMQPDDFGDFKKKITNYFYDIPANAPRGTRGKNINGFPSPVGDTDNYDKDDWKIYFLTCRKFLTDYIEKNISPKFAKLPVRTPTAPMAAYPKVNNDPAAIDAAFEASDNAIDELGLGTMPSEK